MGTFIFDPSEKIYKDKYKKHYDRFFGQYQSKRIKLNKKKYVLFGQQRLKAVPLITYFDVFDEEANSADEKTAKIIHDFVQKLALTEIAIKSFHTHLITLKKSNLNPERIGKVFKFDNINDTLELAQSVQPSINAVEILLEQTKLTLAKKEWTEADISAFENKWLGFWSIYSNRTKALINLLEHNKETSDVSEEEWAKLLFKEAKNVYNQYSLINPTDYKVGTYTIHELIRHNYNVGRLKETDDILKSGHSFIKLLYQMFAGFYNVTAFIIIPITSVILIINHSLNSMIILSFVSFIVIFYIIKRLTRQSILTKNTRYLSKVRSKQFKQN